MAIENGYYSHDHHGDYELISVGELQLEEGGTIPDFLGSPSPPSAR